MRVSTFLCKATAVLVPGAASLYIALRANITLMLIFSGSRPETTTHAYALRLLDMVSLIVLAMAWLAHTIWLESRVRRAAGCERALRVGAQHTGISLMLYGLRRIGTHCDSG